MVKQIKIFQGDHDLSTLEYIVNRWLSKHSTLINEYNTSITYTPTGYVIVVSYHSEFILEITKKP